MDIKAFRGWRYRSRDGDVSSVLAPPYDILTKPDKDALLAADERNIVGVDLPHLPLTVVGPDSAYEAAAARLKGWIDTGVLCRDERPCLYAHEQVFTWGGRRFRRRAMIAAVRLAEFGEGVWPHEKIFAGTKADRMKLTEKTGMQVSPIFGFYEGAESAADVLFEAAGQTPAAYGRLRGVDERLWAVSNGDVIESVVQALAGEPLFIADGHHRYTTALEYRRRLGEIDESHPANYVMFLLAAMDDPGLIVLPAHRIITGLKDFDLERFVASAGKVVEFQRVSLTAESVAGAGGFLRPFGRHAMAFVAADRRGGAPAAYVGRLVDDSVMQRAAPEESDTWRGLDAAILHRLVIDHYLDAYKTHQMAIEYVADGSAVLEAVISGRADLAVFLQPTPLTAVKEIALSGATMPHKSTYFYPKPSTGLVLYPLG